MRQNAKGTLTIMTRIASRFAAMAGLLIAANACTGDETATGPKELLEQPTTPVLDLQPTGLGAAFSTYSFVPFTNDVHGANDYSGQNDVNQLSRADNDGKFGVAWTWDETDAWTGTGQTGDACALFDTDATGTTGANNVDFALCVRVTNLNGNPANPVQADGSPILYQCSDKKNDRCTTTVVSIPKGTTFCEVHKTTTDAFPGAGADGADVMAACGVDLSAISTTTSPKFLNVCSYPSGSPNSNPFDCILTPGAAFLKIVKATGSSTATNTQFSFTLSPAAQNGSTSFDVTDANAGNDESALIPISPSQSYNLSEVSEPGWSLSSASCTGGTVNGTPNSTGVTGFRVGVEGNTIVCTFVNAQNGSITVIKDAKPNADQDFSYTVTGGLSAFDLDDDGDNTNTLKNSKEFASLAAGKRTITESAATGWKITDIDCGTPTSIVKYGVGGGSYTHTSYVDGDNSVEIDLASGENVSCTFENTKLGSITIVKDAVPDSDQDFLFTPTGFADNSNFSLDDDTDGTLASSKPFTGLLPGIRTVSEASQSGWAITDISCTGDVLSTVKIGSDGDFDANDNSVEVDLKDGENVTCTFKNTKYGSITIVKDAVPNNAQAFSYTTTNLTPVTFNLVDDGTSTAHSRTFSNLLPGTYGVAEDGESGWALTDIDCQEDNSATIGNSSVSIALAAGENIVCTFTNTQGGSIKIIKDAQPDHTQDFAFTATGLDVAEFTLDDDNNGAPPRDRTFSGLQPGLRTISEGAVTDWKVTNIVCTGDVLSDVEIGVSGGSYDDNFDANDNSVRIDLAAGENIECTFTNTQKPTITVTKTANPENIPETGGDVEYTIVVTNTSGLPVTLDELTDDKFLNLDGVGDGSTKCDVPQTIAAGATYTCKFTKTLPADAPGATHVNTVTAKAHNDGGNAQATDDATVTYDDVLPAITVTKTARPATFTAVTGTLTFPDPDKVFDEDSDPPPPAGQPNFNIPTCDDGQANDINSSQVDLNCFNRADNVNGLVHVKWTWDDINAWGGGGSTGDGCALIDTDNDGNVNLAVCARITNAANGSIVQVGGAGTADVYVCNDTKVDRCAKQVSTLSTADKKLTTCTVAVVTPDGFPGEGDDGADVEATCAIDKTMPIAKVNEPPPVGFDLVNVCSFPSGEPNSNPFDCVVEVGAGFIQIVKNTNLTTTQMFGFTLAGAATDGSSRYTVQGGVASGLIPVKPTGGQVPLYSLTETLPTNWSMTAATCVVDGEPTINANSATGFNANIIVKTGQTTICTFTNTGDITGNVTYDIVVTNTGTVSVDLFSLNDNRFGNLNGVGTCAVGGTIAVGGPAYTCYFTKTLTGAPGTSHTNVVRAVAKDAQGNPAQASESETVVLQLTPP